MNHSNCNSTPNTSITVNVVTHTKLLVRSVALQEGQDQSIPAFLVSCTHYAQCQENTACLSVLLHSAGHHGLCQTLWSRLKHKTQTPHTLFTIPSTECLDLCHIPWSRLKHKPSYIIHNLFHKEFGSLSHTLKLTWTKNHYIFVEHLETGVTFFNKKALGTQEERSPKVPPPPFPAAVM